MRSKNLKYSLSLIVLIISVMELVMSRPRMFNAEMVAYLERYGYLTPSHSSSNMVSGHQVISAVRNLQYFANLDQINGEFDAQTWNLIRKPRCGLPDVTSDQFRNKRSTDKEGKEEEDKEALRRTRRYAVQGERWPETNLTWRLKQSSSRLDTSLIRRELTSALMLWSSSSPLTFTELTEHKADIEISFLSGYHGDGHPFDGPGQVLAHAFFPGANRGGDVHLDDEEDWSEKRFIDSDTTSLFVVAAHEFGHALGLAHSNKPESIMFPWYTGSVEQGKLPQDDLDAITVLYGEKEEVSHNKENVEEETKEEIDNNEEKRKDGNNSSDQTVIPDACSSRFDAVASIRGEMWVFSANFFWRINNDLRSDALKLDSFWYGLPSNHVDAVYERRDNKLVFFVDKNFYVLNNNAELFSGPTPITRLGLPSALDKVDGAMRWGWNDKTYFFAKNLYWRLDENLQHVELDYPRKIDIWNGVPDDIDAVFQYWDGHTYFFKDMYVYKFDDLRMRVNERQLTKHRFMHCLQEIKDAPVMHPDVNKAHYLNLDCIFMLLLVQLLTTLLNCEL